MRYLFAAAATFLAITPVAANAAPVAAPAHAVVAQASAAAGASAGEAAVILVREGGARRTRGAGGR